MKKLRLIILLTLTLYSLLAQNKEPLGTVLFQLPNKTIPIWTQGTNIELIQDVKSKLIYPMEDCIEGIIILQFRVDTCGKVIDPKIIISISHIIDKQLLEIIVNNEFKPGLRLNKRKIL